MACTGREPSQPSDGTGSRRGRRRPRRLVRDKVSLPGVLSRIECTGMPTGLLRNLKPGPEGPVLNWSRRRIPISGRTSPTGQLSDAASETGARCWLRMVSEPSVSVGKVDDSVDHWDFVCETKASEEVSWFQAESTTSLRLLQRWASPAGSVIDV